MISSNIFLHMSAVDITVGVFRSLEPEDMQIPQAHTLIISLVDDISTIQSLLFLKLEMFLGGFASLHLYLYGSETECT